MEQANHPLEFDFDGFASRLREAIFPRKVTEVADLAEVSQSVISSYLNPREGKAGPRMDVVARLALVLDVSLDWLAFGKGDGPDGLQRIPEYDVQLAAGPGAWNDRAAIIATHPFTEAFLLQALGRRSSEGLAMLGVRGDSGGDNLPDRSKVIIDLRDNRPTDGIFAFVLGGEARVKRIKRLVDGLLLISDNKAYPEERLSGDQLNLITIVGRVLFRLSPV